MPASRSRWLSLMLFRHVFGNGHGNGCLPCSALIEGKTAQLHRCAPFSLTCWSQRDFLRSQGKVGAVSRSGPQDIPPLACHATTHAQSRLWRGPAAFPTRQTPFPYTLECCAVPCSATCPPVIKRGLVQSFVSRGSLPGARATRFPFCNHPGASRDHRRQVRNRIPAIP